MSAVITATGNAGVHVAAGGASVLIDSLWDPLPRLLGGRRPREAPPPRADLILVTHGHRDHFSADRVAEASRKTGATVVAPAACIIPLRKRVADESLIALEPPEPSRGKAAAPVRVELPQATVTAFRTCHARGHNSYLVEMGGWRFFHDGDNEDTRVLDAASPAPLDALFLCPWQGSGWVEFVERLAPRRWFLIHLDAEEIRQHRAGQFLPDLCDHVPLANLTVALEPGEAYTLGDRGK
jgi:L-ascorbate metabolism protein UlaG (beta-lactamase superfamily)